MSWPDRLLRPQTRIEEAKGSGVEWLFPVQLKVVRYSFRTEDARWWISILLVGGLGVFPSWLILLITILNFIKPWGRCRKGMIPSLTSEVGAGENIEINYETISFREIGGNYSVQYPSNLPFSFGFALLRLHKCLRERQITFSGFYGKLRWWNSRLTQVVAHNFDEICSLFGVVMAQPHLHESWAVRLC